MAKKTETNTASVIKSGSKAADKYRNLTDVELQNTTRELQDQLFRLRFQLNMGQTESLNKLRQLRKDVARVKTLARSRALGIEAAAGGKR